MSKLQEFLDELSNYELLKFHEYRYEQFLKSSKDKIDAEFDKRNLKKSDVENVTFKKEDFHEEACPRCASSKFYVATEIESMTYRYASVDIEVDYRTCLVCLYSEKDDINDDGVHFVGFIGFIRKLINRKK